MHISPPHLTVAVFSSLERNKAFREICEALCELDSVQCTGLVCAPKGSRFEAVSDLTEKVTFTSLNYGTASILQGGHPSLEPVRASFESSRFGVVLVEYLRSSSADEHPIAVSLNAATLGLPDFLRTPVQDQESLTLAEWATGLLQEIVRRVAPQYGSIGVEFSLSPPIDMAHDFSDLPSELYVDVSGCTGSIVDEQLSVLSAAGARVERWGTGVFLALWGPFGGAVASREEVARLRSIQHQILRGVVSNDDRSGRS